jgi:nucleotide-binding universal stress UspA family protein
MNAMDAIRNIVVPTDFSPLADAAGARAAFIAQLDGAEVHLVHALTLPMLSSPYQYPVSDSRWKSVQRAAREQLERASKAIETRGLQDVTTELVDARNPVDAIEACVCARRADLVVMGTHGYGRLEQTFLGSVTERTMRRLDVPVLAVKEDVETAAKPIAKLLVAVDFSPFSDRAVATAAALATRLHASLDVVHAFDIAFDSDDYLSAMDPDLGQRVEMRARAKLAEVGQRLERDGVPARVHFLRGRPHVAIADHASAIGCQLIVMGTHGRTGFSHLLLGSVAERTLRLAPCSVLCVKAA